MTELACPHNKTKTIKKVYPEPVGIEYIEVCEDCRKEI